MIETLYYAEARAPKSGKWIRLFPHLDEAAAERHCRALNWTGARVAIVEREYIFEHQKSTKSRDLSIRYGKTFEKGEPVHVEPTTTDNG